MTKYPAETRLLPESTLQAMKVILMTDTNTDPIPASSETLNYTSLYSDAKGSLGFWKRKSLFVLCWAAHVCAWIYVKTLYIQNICIQLQTWLAGEISDIIAKPVLKRHRHNKSALNLIEANNQHIELLARLVKLFKSWLRYLELESKDED